MAYPPLRNMNAELNEGATDGKYNKIVRDRSAPARHYDDETSLQREGLNDVWYARHETPLKRRPDGKPVHTPNFTPTSPAQAGF